MAEGTAVLLSADDRAAILGMYNEMKATTVAIKAKLEAGEPAGELKVKFEKIDQSLVEFHAKHETMIKRADDLEAMIKRAREEAEPPKSIGRQALENPAMLAFLKKWQPGGVVVECKRGPMLEVKDITGLSGLLPQRLDQIATGPRLPFGVRTLIPQGRTTAGSISYIEETSFTNAAAPVAEGAAKPKSDKVFTPKTLPVETIAHYFKISRQAADDLPFVLAQIESNGIYGVQIVEDNQLLNGSGVSPQLKGFMQVAGAAPAPPAGPPASTLVDAIGVAAVDLAAKGYLPDGTVVNPADWGAVSMLKNTLGNYLFSNPMDYSGNQRVWGLRLASSANMGAGNFLVGAFQGNSLLLDREDVNVQIANQNEDDFIKNMYTVLVEERLVLLIFQVAAFEKGVVPAGTL
jgi:HK97 family phage major capsid protein